AGGGDGPGAAGSRRPVGPHHRCPLVDLTHRYPAAADPVVAPGTHRVASSSRLLVWCCRPAAGGSGHDAARTARPPGRTCTVPRLHGHRSAVLHGHRSAVLHGHRSAVLHGHRSAVLHGHRSAVLQRHRSAVLPPGPARSASAARSLAYPVAEPPADTSRTSSNETSSAGARVDTRG